MTEEEIEKEIQALGLTYPRLTPEDIEDRIVSEEYQVFNKTLTICCLTLKNGFVVTGKSACVCAENFHNKLGKKIARDKAKEKIWSLEGYLMKERIYNASTSGIP